MAVDSNLGAVVGVEGGAIDSIAGNEGRIAQAGWMSVEDCVSSQCISGTQKAGLRGMEPCWKQFLKQARTTKTPVVD